MKAPNYVLTDLPITVFPFMQHCLRHVLLLLSSTATAVRNCVFAVVRTKYWVLSTSRYYLCTAAAGRPLTNLTDRRDTIAGSAASFKCSKYKARSKIKPFQI